MTKKTKRKQIPKDKYCVFEAYDGLRRLLLQCGNGDIRGWLSEVQFLMWNLLQADMLRAARRGEGMSEAALAVYSNLCQFSHFYNAHPEFQAKWDSTVEGRRNDGGAHATKH